MSYHQSQPAPVLLEHIVQTWTLVISKLSVFLRPLYDPTLLVSGGFWLTHSYMGSLCVF